MRRRSFLEATLASVTLLGLGKGASAATRGVKRPNILWISAEDISPDLGCYGDGYARTPNIDTFAEKAVRYDRAYSHSGVCAPSRSGIITGMYPTSLGTHHMRCSGIPPAGVLCFTEYLRAAGYYCTNNKKTDYQFNSPPSAWDESSNRAHWRHRPDGVPFFSVVNFTVCHESQVRSRDADLLSRIDALGEDKHIPEGAPVPPYHADTAATRRDWAQYYDVISLMDQQVGETLKQLEADGLAEDTIVWFWGDHGRGLSRGKRWLYESGTRIPLLVHVPEKWRAWVRPDGPETLTTGTNDNLVCFIDFAPTVLSLAGVTPPAHFQGQSFLGQDEAPPRAYIYGARDRMDEAYDLIRTVRDKRFRYFRNYMPYVTYAQDIAYMNEMPMLQDLRRLHAEGKLTPDQEKWFAPRKPLEELYDVEADPNELNNLAGDPKYKADLARLRDAHHRWMVDTKDLGLIPEPEYDAWRMGAGVPRVSMPTVQVEAGKLAMACATDGASITYRWDDEPEGHWHRYSRPVVHRENVGFRVQATRIGFVDSDVVTQVSVNDALSEVKALLAPVDTEDLTPLLEKLWALRAMDVQADAKVPEYLAFMRAEEAPLRYWATVLLHRMVNPALRDDAWVDAVSQRLADDSPVVRIAAAHALCEWERAAEGLPVLAALMTHERQSVRLFAATALLQLGEGAGPALATLERGQRDQWEYVKNVSRAAVARLHVAG